MKASDFNLSKELKFDTAKGRTTFQHSRMLILEANAMGLLRQQIIDAVGIHKAREILLQFGYQDGFADFLQMKLSHDFDSENDLLAVGPMIHTWEGIVRAVPRGEPRCDRASGEFFFTGRWENSYEAEQYLCFNDFAREPVCWTLAGYASGWCWAFFGKPVVAMETACAGTGDEWCDWEIRTPPAWNGKAAPYVAALRQFGI